jgi:hypothetical protein
MKTTNYREEGKITDIESSNLDLKRIKKKLNSSNK